MGEVMQFRASQTPENRDIERALKRLTAKAARGELLGLIIVYETHKEHKSGMAGTYRANPTEALKVASLGLQHLYSYEARKRCDPLTASDIFMSNR